MGIHPTDEDGNQELYLMCDDITVTVKELKRRGIEFTRPISKEQFGLLTSVRIPRGGELGIYQPKHKTALRLKKAS